MCVVACGVYVVACAFVRVICKRFSLRSLSCHH